MSKAVVKDVEDGSYLRFGSWTPERDLAEQLDHADAKRACEKMEDGTGRYRAYDVEEGTRIYP